MGDKDEKELAKALMSAIEAMAESKAKDKIWDMDRINERINDLVELRDRYETYHTLKPGMLVRWKAGLKNKKRPEYNEPAIVMEVMLDPLRDNGHDAGSAYYREPLDLTLGLIDGDGDFVIFHFDQRRFEPLPVPADGED
jgi:hypothetical protein